MDKTVIFIALLAILFLGQVIMTETFYDASGVDASGNITLSLSDLLSLIGAGITQAPAPTPKVDLNSKRTNYALLNEIRYDVKDAVRSELLNSGLSGRGSSGSSGSAGSAGSAYGSQELVDDSCIDSLSAQQGSDFMRYVPGKNPDDYIRKDSVPCYGCSIP